MGIIAFTFWVVLITTIATVIYAGWLIIASDDTKDHERGVKWLVVCVCSLLVLTTDLEPEDSELPQIEKIWLVHWYSYYREYNEIKTKRNTRPFDNEREAMEFKEKLEIARKFLKDQTTANVEIETYEK